MKIRVHCDCGKTLVASDQLAGKSAKCPACGALIRLPRLEEVSEHSDSFLVTETGLNLTTDPQEIGAAPGEEMPPQFSVSSADQTPVTSPECASAHGVSDSSKSTNDSPGRDRAAFLAMIRTKWAEWTGLFQPLTDAEWAALRQSSTNSGDPVDLRRETTIDDPVDLRRVRKRMVDKHGEDDRPNANWFWVCAIAGVSIVMIVGRVISNDQDGTNSYRRQSSRYERFKDDFAPGATANAVERMASTLEDFDQGSALMRSCAVSLLWLIFLALLRINATVETQTKRLLASVERENPPPPK